MSDNGTNSAEVDDRIMYISDEINSVIVQELAAYN